MSDAERDSTVLLVQPHSYGAAMTIANCDFLVLYLLCFQSAEDEAAALAFDLVVNGLVSEVGSV